MARRVTQTEVQLRAKPDSAPVQSLFFCLKPDVSAIAGIERTFAGLARDHHLEGKLVAAETLHATLYFVGRTPPQPPTPIAALLAAAEAVRVAEFDVLLDRAVGFDSGARRFPNVLLFDPDSARAAAHLHQALADAVAAQGIAPLSTERFVPHVTLSRSASRWLHAGPIAQIRWRARDFALIQSIHDGARHYRELGRWRLRE